MPFRKKRKRISTYPLGSLVGAWVCLAAGITVILSAMSARYWNSLESENQKVPMVSVNDVGGESYSLDVSDHSGCQVSNDELLLDCMIQMEQLLRNYQPLFYHASYPILASIVPTRSGSLRYIMNMKLLSQKNYDSWFDSEWLCDDNVNNLSIQGRDSHGHTLVIDCNGTLSVNNSDSLSIQAYPFHKGCPVMKGLKKVILCTSIRGVGLEDDLKEWVAYHSLIGVDHFYVYVNDNFDLYKDFKLPNTTFIPFENNNFGEFTFQQAQQNDCLHRSKERAEWVGMNDIDEFFYLPKNLSLKNYLSKIRAQDIGAVQVKSIFYGTNGVDLNSTTNLKIDKYCWRSFEVVPQGREKIFLQPSRVDYISVHEIALGGPTVQADPLDIRLVHFKLSEEGVYESFGGLTYDDSLRRNFLEYILEWCGILE